MFNTPNPRSSNLMASPGSSDQRFFSERVVRDEGATDKRSNLQTKKSGPKLRFSILASFVALSSSFSTASYAACENFGCACIASELQFASPTTSPDADGQYPISLEADDVESEGETLVTLTGNAEVTQGRQTIVADQIQYYRENDRVVATGNVEMISENGDYLSSQSIDVHAPTQIGRIQGADFKLAKGMTSADGVDTVQIASRGSASTVDLEGEGLLRLEDAKYTTCPEGSDAVMISASNLELDQLGGIGRARNATIRFQGVPIFYTPYISFPINDERKTGFLTPGFGSDDDSGNIIEFPWYWNIAKNQDATITPSFYTDRGFQIAGEYRLITQNSNTLISGAFLGDDDLYRAELEAAAADGESVDADRSVFSLRHFHQFTDNLSGSINYNDVSDVDYFDDLRNEINYFSATFVPRDIQLNYEADYFRVQLRANEYQIIDPDISPARAPYERIPSLYFSTNLPDGPLGLQYGLSATYNDFSVDSDVRDEGSRVALNPYINLPFKSIWGYVTPSLSLHHRSYDLESRQSRLDPTQPRRDDDSPSFTVPIFSVDAGIYLEKNINWFGDKALQTLEPRVFYAYAPDEDQDDVPIFDTSQVSLNNFSNIWRANRFYGEDRVGDTNQLTVGLTTRVIDNETGDQRLQASFGQLYLVDDLQQNLRGSGEPIESGLGDFLAEIRTESNGAWTTYGFVQYDYDISDIRTASFAVGYEPKDDNRKRVSIGYYLANGATEADPDARDVDQLTMNVSWPISDRWQFFASERYSLEDSESLFTDIGVEYDSCCWKFRITGQERISSRNIDEKKKAIFFELELTSLGSIRTGF